MKALKKLAEKFKKIGLAGRIAICIFVVALLAGVILFAVIGKWTLRMKLNGNAEEYVEYMATYEDAGATASYGSKHIFTDYKKVEVTSESDVDTTKLGTYSVNYTASYKNLTVTKSRTVIVQDSTAPVITLNYKDDYYTRPGEKYREEGYTAYDTCDGDLTSRVVVKDGTDGYRYYEVTDRHGNTATEKRFIVIDDREAPVITLKGDAEMTVDLAAGEYKEPGFTAEDDVLGDITDKVEVSEPVYENDYTAVITYSVSDDYGNKAEVKRRITFTDSEAPVITLKGDAEIVFDIDGSDVFEEPGWTAEDEPDGDLTDKVEVSESEGRDKYETIYTYTVKDKFGNETTVTRSVRYKDMIWPELTLLGDAEIEVSTGEDWTEPGYSASDNREGDITGKVKVSSDVNPYRSGTYTITYSVSDDFGNTTEAYRKLVVKPRPQPDKVDPGNKVVYLTFDDGPGPYTQELLDVLAKYNVKATFFVTAANWNYIDLIGAEAAAGHTVAVHSYTHNYGQIYASEDAFFADFYKMQDLIYDQTGIRTTLLRFPGGSSNTVSASYCRGIMSALAADVADLGFQYFDWNVASGDAGETTSTSTVISNVISGISNHNVSVVLQHDIKGFSVAAVEEIIAWGIDNGYTFLPLTASSPTAHHGINN